MRNVLEAIIAARESGKDVVFTSLIETRGSTPQKPGATMLVYEDGSQVGTLGGGCVEAEVKRQALENLATRTSEVVSFQLNHDYGWDDGLICGGRMKMLISPVAAQTNLKYLQTTLELLQTGKGLTEAVLLDDSIGITGTQFLFDHNETFVTSSTGETPPRLVTENLPPLKLRPRPSVFKGVSYLPRLPLIKLIVVGAGHIGRQLTTYATDADFEVTVVDDREIYCNQENIPTAKNWVVGEFDEVLPNLKIDDQTYCVIVTRGHNHDEEALFHIIKRNPKFVGMIGSKRKIKLIFDDLIRNGIDAELLDRVRAPIGLEIGSQTVPEIAISIAAQLIQHRNCESNSAQRKKNTPADSTSEACD